MVDPHQSATVEQLQNDLQVLASDISLAKVQLGLSNPPSPTRSPTKDPKSAPHTRATTRSRFSRLTSALRLARTKNGRRHSYQKLEEERLILPERRPSDESDITLVDRESASFLLSVLAPLVATLQACGAAMSTLENDMNLLELFLGVIKELEGLIEGAREHDDWVKIDHHDAEMRSLLLDALLKKVQAERTKVQLPRQHSIASSVSHDTPGPLAPISRNPFVFHANALSKPPSRTCANSKPIVPPSNTAIGAGNFTSFAAMGQSSWRMNVHRLGSFQASMLFSPSPVAVRRTMP